MMVLSFAEVDVRLLSSARDLLQLLAINCGAARSACATRPPVTSETASCRDRLYRTDRLYLLPSNMIGCLSPCPAGTHTIDSLTVSLTQFPTSLQNPCLGVDGHSATLLSSDQGDLLPNRSAVLVTPTVPRRPLLCTLPRTRSLAHSLLQTSRHTHRLVTKP
jgi:hypothetical protein